MLELKNICLEFNKGTEQSKKVFNNFSLKVDEGEFLTIIGHNGSGKSTLMNIIAGELSIDTGTIKLADMEITHKTIYERAKYISRVFQDPNMGTCGTLSIEENLALAIRRDRTRTLSLFMTKSLKENFKEILKNLNMGLENRLKEPIGLLSGGQRQAVNLIMATLVPSRLLLLDEHTAALDPAMVKIVINLTKAIYDKKDLTILMITHSMEQATNLGTRVISLKDGVVEKEFNKNEGMNNLFRIH